MLNEDWKKKLTPEQYHVLREKGTEQAFKGAYWNEHRPGLYKCAGCGTELFRSAAKFDSGTGWLSFYQPSNPNSVAMRTDDSYGMERTEAVCPVCGSHLGHVFDDGPKPPANVTASTPLRLSLRLRRISNSDESYKAAI